MGWKPSKEEVLTWYVIRKKLNKYINSLLTLNREFCFVNIIFFSLKSIMFSVQGSTVHHTFFSSCLHSKQVLLALLLRFTGFPRRRVSGQLNSRCLFLMPSGSTGKFWALRGTSRAQPCRCAESSMYWAPCLGAEQFFCLGQPRVLPNFWGQNQAHGKGSYNWRKMSANTQAPAPRLDFRPMPRGAGGGMGIPEELSPKDPCHEALRRRGGAGRLGRKSMLSGNKWKVREAVEEGACAILPTDGE